MSFPIGNQNPVLQSGLLSSGFSCILQMPTGSGKTWLAEQAMQQVIAAGKRAVYLTPLRALADELFERWRKSFSSGSVGVFTGDYDRSNYPISFKDAKLLILTPEKFDGCLRNWRSHWGWLPEVDLIVADEFHLLGETRRGARLEGALLRFAKLNPFARIIGLSATLGNVQELAAWLGGTAYRSDERPVPLRWRTVRYRKAEQKPELLLREVKAGLSEGKSLVFVQSRRRAELLRALLAENNLRALHHHAGLNQAQRKETERAFRSGEVDVLVATATLELGLNLPVRQVILYDLQGFDGEAFTPLRVNNVWQRAGRAGRPGLDDAGDVVMFTPGWDRSSETYPQGRFETITSQFINDRDLAEQIVAEVASGLSRTRRQLKVTFSRSLAEMQGHTLPVKRITEEMLYADMLKETEVGHQLRLKATWLGHITVRHHLKPATVLRFRQVLTNQAKATFFDFLLLAACTDDCEPLLFVDFEELELLARALNNESSHLLDLPTEELVGLLGVDGKRLLAALNTAFILGMWTRYGDAEAVAERCGCYPFEVTRLRESAVRLLQAMNAVALLVAGTENNDDPYGESITSREKLRMLLRMVQGGLDEEAATLTHLSGLGPTLAKRLDNVGIHHIEDLALATPADVCSVRGISKARAQAWIGEAETLVKSIAGDRYREATSQQDLTAQTWPVDIDPYRLKRALELTVVSCGGRTFRVSGGLEPHTVRCLSKNYKCDCADFAKGNTCKHILGVRLERGDRPLKRVANRLNRSRNHSLDLMNLWMARIEK